MHTNDTRIGRALHNFSEGHPGKKVFLEHEVKGLFSAVGMRVPRSVYVTAGETEALSSHGLRYPLVAKLASTTTASKTDVGGVVPSIADETALRKAVADIMGIGGAEGVLVEEMAPRGTEVIVGGVVDPQFGPVIMFGLGGLFVELFRDVAFGLAPLSAGEAAALVERTAGARLLRGFRGRRPSDIGALSEVMVAASELMATGRVQELDLNPVAVYPEGALILDAKLKLLDG